MKINLKETGCAVIILFTIACSVLAVGSGYVAYRAGRFVVYRTWVPFFELIWGVTESAFTQPTGDAFFESYGGFDFRRIALIEPYHAVSIDKKTWRVWETNTERMAKQYPIEQIDVIDKRVIVFPSTAGWHVIVPSEKLDTVFSNQTDFDAFLKTHGISDFNPRDANALFNELVDKGCLSWYPQHWCK